MRTIFTFLARNAEGVYIALLVLTLAAYVNERVRHAATATALVQEQQSHAVTAGRLVHRIEEVSALKIEDWNEYIRARRIANDR